MVMRPITIRFPDDLASEAQVESKSSGKSLNQLVIDAVAEVIAQRRAERALGEMKKRVAAMRAAGRTGKPSEPAIRRFREGIDRRS